MIRFTDWVIHPVGDVIARQYDNKTRVLSVIGDMPDGWTWVMMVRVGDYMDYLPLSPIDGGVGIELTASHLSIAGHYDLQLRGTRGEEVRHTNITSVNIPESLTGDAQWPIVPSEFSDLERRIVEFVGGANASEQAAAEHKARAEKAAVLAEGYTSHPPVIGENGNWWTWDGEQYTDSGNPGKGEDATTRIVGEVVDDTLVLYTESGALIHAEVNGDTLCIG